MDGLAMRRRSVSPVARVGHADALDPVDLHAASGAFQDELAGRASAVAEPLHQRTRLDPALRAVLLLRPQLPLVLRQETEHDRLRCLVPRRGIASRQIEPRIN